MNYDIYRMLFVILRYIAILDTEIKNFLYKFATNHRFKKIYTLITTSVIVIFIFWYIHLSKLSKCLGNTFQTQVFTFNIFDINKFC